MAVRLTAASSQYLSLGSVLDYNANYTWIGWVRPETVAANATIMQLMNSNQLDHDRVRFELSLNKFVLRVVVNNAGTNATGTIAPTAGQWTCLAVVRDGVTSCKFYEGTTAANLALSATNARDVTSRTAGNTTRFGTSVAPAGTEFWDGRMLAFKTWTRALTLAELQSEAAVLRPASLDSIWAHWPLLQTGDYLDYSGRGRGLSATGTPTTEDSEAIAWGGTPFVLPLSVGVRLELNLPDFCYLAEQAVFSLQAAGGGSGEIDQPADWIFRTSGAAMGGQRHSTDRTQVRRGRGTTY